MSEGSGALPAGWEKDTLGTITRIRTGKLDANAADEDGRYPFFTCADEISRIDDFAFDTEAVLLAGNGGFNVKWHLGKFNAYQRTYVIEPKVVSGRFLYHLIKYEIPEITGKNRGSTIKYLRLGDIADCRIELPPLAEQRRIVAKIEALQERSSRARRALADVGPLLEQLRQSVLQAAFSGRLTADWRAAHPDVEPAAELLARIRTERRQRWETAELAKYEAKGKKPPKNWQEKYKEPGPLQDDELEILHDQSLPNGWIWAPAELIVEPEAEIVYGIVQPGKKLEKGVPYVRGKDIVDGVILVDQLLNTSEKIAARYERASLKGGDVLLGIIRATKVAIVPDGLDGANITQGTARFRPSDIIRTSFLAGWLASPSAQNWLHDHYRGIDMPGLNLRDVRRLPVPIVSLAEQEVLESQIATAIELVTDAKVQVAESESSLTQLDQSILAKAFRGELVPQDPDDEPASQLLERIRKKRDDAEAAQKNGKKKSAKRKRKAKT